MDDSGSVNNAFIANGAQIAPHAGKCGNAANLLGKSLTRPDILSPCLKPMPSHLNYRFFASMVRNRVSSCFLYLTPSASKNTCWTKNALIKFLKKIVARIYQCYLLYQCIALLKALRLCKCCNLENPVLGQAN